MSSFVTGLSLITFILSNWDTFIDDISGYLPIVGKLIDTEITTEIQDQIDNGELTYNELTSTLEEKLETILAIDWGEVSYEQNDPIEVLPDHIWILVPGTEIVLCDLINAANFFASLDWTSIRSISTTILGRSLNASTLSVFFDLAGDTKVFWSEKLKYRDSTTGVVNYGYAFDPEKNIKYNQIEPYAMKFFAFGILYKLTKKFNFMTKLWKVLKAGNNWRARKFMRNALNAVNEDADSILSNQTTLLSNDTTQSGKLDTLISSDTNQDADLDDLIEKMTYVEQKFKGAYSPQKGVITF